MHPIRPTDRPRVLVVEDERSTARLLEYVLRKAGYDVAVAGDGIQAVHLVDAFRPVTMLLDLQLPGLSGIEVLSRIRQAPDRHQPAVIILSGTSFEIAPEQALLAGAQAHCTKPIAPSTLIRKLREVASPNAAAVVLNGGGDSCLSTVY